MPCHRSVGCQCHATGLEYRYVLTFESSHSQMIQIITTNHEITGHPFSREHDVETAPSVQIINTFTHFTVVTARMTSCQCLEVPVKARLIHQRIHCASCPSSGVSGLESQLSHKHVVKHHGESGTPLLLPPTPRAWQFSAETLKDWPLLLNPQLIHQLLELGRFSLLIVVDNHSQVVRQVDLLLFLLFEYRLGVLVCLIQGSGFRVQGLKLPFKICSRGPF